MVGGIQAKLDVKEWIVNRIGDTPRADRMEQWVGWGVGAAWVLELSIEEVLTINEFDGLADGDATEHHLCSMPIHADLAGQARGFEIAPRRQRRVSRFFYVFPHNLNN